MAGSPSKRAKAAALLALTFQNALLAILMKYSRTATRAHGGHYLSSTVVVVTEIAKGVLALILLQVWARFLFTHLQNYFDFLATCLLLS